MNHLYFLGLIVSTLYRCFNVVCETNLYHHVTNMFF